jgi:hypothetical protein
MGYRKERKEVKTSEFIITSVKCDVCEKEEIRKRILML